MDGETLARVGYLAIILVALGGWAMVEFRQRMGQALRMAMAWGLIFIGVVAGYGLWTDIRHDAMPIQAVAQDGTVEVPRAADGHYYLTLTVNGTPVRFMVDTGATLTALSPRTAQAVGVEAGPLGRTVLLRTANGQTQAELVTLGEMRFGNVVARDLDAVIAPGLGETNVIGMNLLSRLAGWRVEDQTLVLQPNHPQPSE